MLELKDLDVFYDQSQVLRGVSLRVEAGEIVCLIGGNGVGKSTTMKAIVGLVRARGGAISFKGQDVLGLPTYRVARAGVGYVPEDRRVFGGLTVLQNLRVAMSPSRSGRPWTLSDIYEIFPVLEQRRGQVAGSLSGGEQQMLTIARTLLGNPDLVLIDEPNEGLAPMYVQRVNAMIEEVHKRGTAVLLVEQSLASVKALAHRAYVMSRGEIVYQGGAQELLSDPAVRQRYLEL